MKTRDKLALVVAAGVLCFGGLALAEPRDGSDFERRGPPPEAIEACSGANEGETCVVDTPHGTLEGTCRQVPEVAELACVPNDHRGGPPRGQR